MNRAECAEGVRWGLPGSDCAPGGVSPAPAVATLSGARVETLLGAVRAAYARRTPRGRVVVPFGVRRTFGRLECLCEGAEVTLGVVVAPRVVIIEDAEYHVP